jgi:hypothetical protein
MIHLTDLIEKFVYGLQGPRQNPVSLRQIQKRFSHRPASNITELVQILLDVERIAIVANGPHRFAQSWRQGYSYVPGPRCHVR